MKRLSDYKGEEAIELWGELFTPVQLILADNRTLKILSSGKSLMSKASEIFKAHPKEIVKILETIDNTPLDGMNVFTRFLVLVEDIQTNESTAAFFGLAGQAKTDNVSTGSAMANTEADEN